MTVAGKTVAEDPDADFEAAADVVLRLPADHPGRGILAAGLITAFVERPLDSSIRLMRHVQGLLATADSRPPPSAQWPRIRRMAGVLALVHAVAEGPPDRLDSIEAELDSLAAQAADDPQMLTLLDLARPMLAYQRATTQGNASVLRELPDLMADFGSSMPDFPGLAQMREIITRSTEAFLANQAGDFASAVSQFDLMQRALQALPAGPLKDALGQASVPWDWFRRSFDDNGAPQATQWSEDEVAALTSLADGPGVDPVIRGLVAGASLLRHGEETDLARIDQGIAQFRTALARTAPGDEQHAFCLQSVGLGLFRRSEVSGTTAELPEAIELLERARDLLGDPRHPNWSLVNETLSVARQRVGDHGGVRESALAGQRGYAWRVLLEADADGARVAVRNAAQDAVDIARRCLGTDDPAAALSALDGGRGLLLFAAMESHRIPARLEAVGRPELARRWREEPVPSLEVRRKALEALTNQSAGGLFDPPALREIQAALARLDADALVYLVPGPPPHGGLAVMAPASGPPAYMPLPNLNLAEDTDVDRYLSALATRDPVNPMRDLSGVDGDDFADRVEALCGWAWRAAMGPLLESYLPRVPSFQDDRVPRIVLIPMGELGRVPWQAARRKDGVYAAQLAAITQGVSARLLCDNAALPAVVLGPTGMVVADPDVGLRAAPLRSARTEAHALRRAFYRGARYVGRLPDGRPSPSGAGTADEVRTWLRNRSPSAGAMLHLACHAYFASGPQGSARLLLAGEENELSFGELVDLLGEAPDRTIGLVVLAACNTGRAVYGYDEAYSLGTGFLAGGVRSVLSTQWSVPDTATSWLMYMFHHYLRHGGLLPWQALRLAQMWMLDPDRATPPGMPPELVPGPGDDPAAVLNWAGFVHYGQ